jgi:hypothetical protein
MRFSLALASLVVACAPNERERGPAPPQPAVLVFEMQSREMTYDDCVAGSEGCTYVRFDYPHVVEAPAGAAVEAVARAIDSFLAAPLRPDEPPASASAFMRRFLSDFEEFKAKEPSSAESWFLERKAFVLRSAPGLVSLSFSERSYLGGAHGLATLHYLNLDPATGSKKLLADILKDGALAEVTRLAEARFRAVRGVPEGTSLKDAGFTFATDAFALTDNFALRDDGLAFYYNPYDVAPYAMGPTEIALKLDEIRDLLKPDFVPQTGATAPPQREP